MNNTDTITIALPKGRMLKPAIKILADANIDAGELLNPGSKLMFENPDAGLKFMLIRAQDVPTYIEYGAADMGIAGSDVLAEQGKDLYEPLDMGIGRCRMVVAEPAELEQSDNPARWTRIRVATKYPNITTRYFTAKGVQVDLIKLYGSIELAPILGLSERIVDLVETGSTLKANGLVEVETIMNITSKLVCNRASLKIKPTRIKELVEKLTKAVAAGQVE